MDKEKLEHWQTALDEWDNGKVTRFMLEQIATLHDSEGRLLPEAARNLLWDLVLWKKKKPRKSRNEFTVPVSLLRREFKARVITEQTKESGEKLRGAGTASQRAIESLAEDFNKLGYTERRISGIVYPRKKQKTKP